MFLDVAKMLVRYDLNGVLDTIEPLLWDTDKYKQRAGAEVWAGFMRGKVYSRVLLSSTFTDFRF
jgi:hypothetical protein